MARSIALSIPHSAQDFEQYLCIGITAHGATGDRKLVAYGAVVVDFAVEGDDVTTIGRMHRLCAART